MYFIVFMALLSIPWQLTWSNQTTVKDYHTTVIEKKVVSAQACAKCHPRQYNEWAVSPHAYAQASPVFNAMQSTILKLTNGTNGDFCIRCHTPIGMLLNEKISMPNENRHLVSQEGVTCIACHRIGQSYGKINGRIPLKSGGLTEVIYGPSGNDVLAEAFKNKEDFPRLTKNKTHQNIQPFKYLSASGFCGTCHDVTFVNGFRLEEAFSEFKNSPSAKRGETCQDCHMGPIPGKVSRFEDAPAAQVNKTFTRKRKRTDHSFVGPDYSVIHPGIFPHPPANKKPIATWAEWLTFDHEAGWGSREFERKVKQNPSAYRFPQKWLKSRSRKKAYRYLQKHQLSRLSVMSQARKTLLQNGYQLGELVVDHATSEGLTFKIKVKNGTDAHHVPTGFTGERLVFLRVVVTDAQGKQIFISGDLDPNGDVRDLHSLFVHDGALPLDTQLFSLQSRFLTRNVRGGEREQVLAVNYSIDPLPFVRPDPSPTVLTGRTLGARIHKQGIEPNGFRWAEYTVSPKLLADHVGPYHVNIQLIAGMVPVNLIDAIKEVGFNYGMSAKDIADKVVAGHQVLWERKHVLTVGTHEAPES